jgi:AMP deaminase
LKTDNSIEGRYLAELTKEVMGDLEASKYQLAEWRISIYGRKKDEWSKLASWFYNHKLAHRNIRWLIQVPRLFHIYRQSGELQNFEEMISNIFEPLFEVTLDPSVDPNLYYFLETIVGFDSVDDESKPDGVNITPNLTSPRDWTIEANPPYAMYMYYMWANICTLNKLRASKGLCTFQFRPHSGESGSLDHLIASYLLAHQINHGVVLKKSPSLQYLYYLSQIGIAMSPLSNNKLFLDYHKNPFPKFFSQGMNVSLSTDDPLMLHYTKDALVEEYSVATQVWKLSSVDQCEIARNSVLQSGWEMKYKKHFLGDDLRDIRETNVPHIRLIYRDEILAHELDAILKAQEH